MSIRCNPIFRPLLLVSCAALHFQASAADEIIIDGGTDNAAPAEIVIDGGQPSGGEILIDEPAAAAVAPAAETHTAGNFRIGIDDVRFEYGSFTHSGSASNRALYGKVAASANWQPDPAWEMQLAARVDGYEEDGSDDFSKLDGDYGDSFVRYRGDNLKVTLGTQTVIWGRLDELPLSDRVSTADLTRGVVDDLEDRRRSNPMLRVESFIAGGKLDLVWLMDFRAAEMPDRDSVWYPVDRRKGRLLGFDPDDVPPALIRNAVIDEDEPDGDGGFGARYTRSHSFADIGMTVAHTRQSMPYYRAVGNTLHTEYPRSWAFGIDAATNIADAIWRIEAVYSSDNPVTRRDLSYTTVEAVQWGVGVEMHPGDGDARVNLQLIGSNLIGAPHILDRSEIYTFNGEIEIPFDRERWRASLDFNLGLDAKDVYLNPEVAFLGWEPHELFVAAHYLEGSVNTLGGFYRDASMVNVGWRAKF
ncbi:MAG: hypothetical protein KDJ24_15185 [Gammaproteobacteria bacterium]|nr:hypothetical protein [Gammaproteobacteria bacterium]